MQIKKRLFEDYFKPSRLPQYEEILLYALSCGYSIMGVLDFFHLIRSGEFDKEQMKVLVNRHDIDTSPRVTREIFEIEKRVIGHSGSASYYFRDSTMDVKLIQEIEEFGYETGYHYEELAKIVKRKKLRDEESVRESIPDAAALFLRDLKVYREKTKTNSLTVASHGDYINTRFQIQNYELLRDEETRSLAGIIVEAYDNSIVSHYAIRLSDHEQPNMFYSLVKKAIAEDKNAIFMLTHPRNQKVDILFNTKDNFNRAISGIKYLL